MFMISYLSVSQGQSCLCILLIKILQAYLGPHLAQRRHFNNIC